MRKLLAGLTILLGLASPALAQQFTMPPPAGVSVLGVPIVASCGTPPATYTAGKIGYLMMDTSGKLCDSGAGGGGSVTQGTVPWVVSGQGTAGTAAIGVVTVQGIAGMTKLLVTPDSVALPANQSVNEAQINGVTPLMGNGVTGTGSQRVTVASDNTAFAVNAATQGAVNITLTDCSGTIASGATAQNAFTAAATRHGFTIANIDTTEVLWISFTTTAAASGTGSFPLGPADATVFTNLSSFTSPPGMGINTALSVIAATTSHKYSCTVW